jgi:DNA-directed RNA polymerase subunit alpha
MLRAHLINRQLPKKIMEKVSLPTKIELKSGEADNVSILTVEPCFSGYGTTIGNALRRVLLSSLPGAAVTAVKIKGAQHEFSTVSKTKEDVLEILLNLKSLRVKLFTDEKTRIRLYVKGGKEVTAKDFEKNSNVQIINPELHIATLTDKDAEFELEAVIEKGYGYSPTEEREKSSEQEIGLMSIDALFSPVKNVGFKVEDVRVGQLTNYDKLTLTIETDGTISANDAVVESTQILLDHFNLFLSLKEEAPIKIKKEKKSGEISEKSEETPKKKRAKAKGSPSGKVKE